MYFTTQGVIKQEKTLYLYVKYDIISRVENGDNMNKRFITFEGGEGTGKTTLIEKLMVDLKDAGFDAIKTREPGGSKISEQIRNVILNVENTEMEYMTEALLYAASRCQHLEEVIKPALNAGKVVICDRYIDSSLAYQGVARDLGIDKVYKINDYAISGFYPDLTIYIDVDPEIGLARIKQNHRDMDRLDLEKIAFHNKVRSGYLEVAKMFPDRIKVIDGNDTIDNIYKKIKEIVFDSIK